MFDLGHFTNCCACSRKANLDVGEDVTEDGNARARHPAFFFGGERHRTRISQLGGVGIVFEGTEEGGLEVRLPACPLARPGVASHCFRFPHALPAAPRAPELPPISLLWLVK